MCKLQSIEVKFVTILVSLGFVTSAAVVDTKERFLHSSVQTSEAGKNSTNREIDAVEVNYLHVYSHIHYRYVRTRILTQLTNNGPAQRTAIFYIQIPKNEFVTEFTIERNGAHFKGKAEVTDTGQNKYLNQSARANRLLGVVELNEASGASSTQFDTYKMTIYLPGSQTVEVTFVYEGLIHKVSGNNILLHYNVNIKPEQVLKLKSFEVKVNIDETRMSPPRLANILGKRTPSKLIVIKQAAFKLGENSWQVSWSPNSTELQELIVEEVLGEVSVMYDIVPWQNETDRTVVVRDGYLTYLDDSSWDMTENPLKFKHELLPRHVVFILDVSGSMEGHRMKQLKLGMTKILNLMESTLDYKNTSNFIDIVAFSNKVEVWSPLRNTTVLHPLSDPFKELALNFIQNLTADGSTNILAALEAGIGLARKTENLNLKAKSILFFVTDGEATSGIINPDLIRARVKAKNPGSQIPIYSLAFGSEADFGLCRNISSDTKGGLARKIFDLDTEDAAASFEMFYKQIASRSLENVTNFLYTTPFQYISEITHQQIISVQMDKNTSREEGKITALKFDATTFETPCAEYCLMERIFALRRIKKLHKMSRNQTLVAGYCSRAQMRRTRGMINNLTNIREANSIAILHNFVTHCTSLFVRS